MTFDDYDDGTDDDDENDDNDNDDSNYMTGVHERLTMQVRFE